MEFALGFLMDLALGFFFGALTAWAAVGWWLNHKRRP
jgi:hypothetical protein